MLYRTVNTVCNTVCNTVLNNCAKKQLYLTSVRHFFEPYKSGSKRHELMRQKKYNDMTELDKVVEGWRLLTQECKLWLKECKNTFDMSRSHFYWDDDEIVKFWHFDQRYNHSITSFYNLKDGDKNDLPKWSVACDSTFNDGYSKASVDVSPAGRALIHGYLDTRLPQHGLVNNTGFVCFQSPKERLSFYRVARFEWEEFTHLVVKLRGDGRAWRIILDTGDDDDLMWFDRYTYKMFTHGGPYWQVCKIPFSRFFFTFKQAIQDHQAPINLTQVRKIGFVLNDHITGPFSLEIEYVGCVNQKGWTEDFAYEMYYVKESAFPQPLSTVP